MGCQVVIPPLGWMENQPQLLCLLVILSTGHQSWSPVVTFVTGKGKGDQHIVECFHLWSSMEVAQGCLVIGDWQPWP